MICPSCQEEETMEAIEDCVDIGVGVQTHVIGYDCIACGEQFSVCSSCGSLDIEGYHQEWCFNFNVMGNFITE